MVNHVTLTAFFTLGLLKVYWNFFNICSIYYDFCEIWFHLWLLSPIFEPKILILFELNGLVFPRCFVCMYGVCCPGMLTLLVTVGLDCLHNCLKFNLISIRLKTGRSWWIYVLQGTDKKKCDCFYWFVEDFWYSHPEILLCKLNWYGTRGLTLEWTSNYLSNRLHCA